MRVNAASLDIRDATTSTPGTLNDLTTDLIMANNNNNKEAKRSLKVVWDKTELKTTTQPKYLGVTLDRSLSY